MIRVITIDDEPLALRQLSGYIRRIPYLELVGECQSAHQAMALIGQGGVDAVFSDINMPDLNGLDFVRSLDEPPIVVFTTAYSGYALEGYKVNAIDYLLKPLDFDELRAACEKVRRQYDLLHPQPAAEGTEPADGATATTEPAETELAETDSVFLKTEHRIVRVSVDNIRFVEGMSEYLKIHMCDGTRPLLVLLSMKRMEQRLPSSLFMRIHRSYIVNIRCITEVNKNRVFLGHDTALPIGDLYKEQLRQYIESKYVGK